VLYWSYMVRPMMPQPLFPTAHSKHFSLGQTDRVAPGATRYLFLGRHVSMGVYRYIHIVSGQYHKDDSLCFDSEDSQEGAPAFGEKRCSVFKSRERI
jgi:hypothetical protein